MLKHLPPAILDSHVAVLGKTGVGKSGGIRAAVLEPMLDAGERVCCIDPTDTQWGIRLTPDGRPSKYKVIVFGGNHGDRALNAHEGEAIGEAVGTSSSSVIISTKKMRPRERTVFFTDFAEALLRTNVGILHLIIDEAHLFAPQAGGMGLGKEAAAMLHATNDLVSLGRGAGLCIVLATQRPAKIHKDSVSQCETLIAMRMSHPLDQAAVEDWIGLKRIKKMKTLPAEYLERAEKIMGGVQFLADRNAYVWAPDPKINVFDQIAFPTYKTFDSGERNKAGATMKLTPIDMTALEGKLKQVAEEAEANDPAKLKGEIARLQAELANRPIEAPVVVDHAAERDAGYRDGFATGKDHGYGRGRSWGAASGHVAEAKACDAFLTHIEERINILGSDVAAHRNELAETIAGHRANMDRIEGEISQSGPAGASTSPAAPTRAAPPMPQRQRATTPSPSPGGDGTNSPALDKTLAAMIELAALGVHSPKREMVAAMAGYANIGSRPIREAFGECLSFAYASAPEPGRLRLTELGRSKVSAPPRPMTTTDMRNRIVAAVGSPADKVLDVLIQNYPRQLSREFIAERCNYANIQSRPIRSAFSKLIDMGFVETPSAGHLVASKALFP